MMKHAGLLSVALILGLSSLASAGQVWNLENEFSTAGTNPHDVWTYGSYALGTADFTTYDKVTTDDPGSTYTYWSGTQTSWPGFVCKNLSSNPNTTFGYYEAGQVVLHPGASGEEATVRWTAPSAMTVDVNALFTGQVQAIPASGLLGTTTDVYVIKNSSAQLLAQTFLDGFYGSAAAGYTDRTGANPFVAYTGTVEMNAGDYLDFLVCWGSNEDFNRDSTGLALTITEVPEPTTLSLVALGGVALLRRRNK